jgi:hypothetical protein
MCARNRKSAVNVSNIHRQKSDGCDGLKAVDGGFSVASPVAASL